MDDNAQDESCEEIAATMNAKVVHTSDRAISRCEPKNDKSVGPAHSHLSTKWAMSQDNLGTRLVNHGRSRLKGASETDGEMREWLFIR